ncbi:MAG: hypothetical protein KJN84_06980 [Bacteroidia bacterium]|nr:hypothetical protein [Bacteroidia bacterium]
MVNRYFIRLLICFITFTLISLDVKSEGTKQLAPNESIVIEGNETHDIASLHIDSPIYNNFASRKNKNPESRLYVHISDPTSECIFLGFSAAHLMNDGGLQDIEYWVLDPSGKEIFGGVKLFDGESEIKNWQEAVNGPEQLNGNGGYNATYISSDDLTSRGWTGEGDYYIEFRNRSSGLPFLIDYFDITVASNNNETFIEKPGRVWAYNWALFSINDFGFPNRPFNGSFYICAPDTYDESKSFISKIDFNGSGFQPAAFNFAFNSFGTDTTGNVVFDRQSVENRNRTLWEYPIYLNDPVDICEEAILGDAKIQSIRRCDNNGFEFGVYIKAHSEVNFLLDFHDQDGIFTANTKDVVIAESFEFDGLDTLVFLFWDGIDGLGNDYNNLQGGEIPVKMIYGQTPFHFPIYDGEYLFNGLNVEQVRPRSFNPTLLFYDDTNITEDPGNNNVKAQLVGCESPCHSWDLYLNQNFIGFGNKNTINTWWFAHQIQEEKVFDIPSYYTCSIEGPSGFCENETIKLLARPRLNPLAGEPYPISEIAWNGPGIVGSNNLSYIELDEEGEYTAEIFWINDDDVECSSVCAHTVEMLTIFNVVIDTTIILGNIVEINAEQYFDEGSFIQNLTANNGCDSILTINVDVIIPDVILTCKLEGPPTVCTNETTLISSLLTQSILPDYPVNILSYEWSGPNIIKEDKDQIEIGEEGIYSLLVNYKDLNDNTLITDCQIQIIASPVYNDSLSIDLFRGETFTLNNIEYSESGQYVDSLLTVDKCDSIININIQIKELPIYDQYILFDMSDCRSSDYEKLVASFDASDDCLSLEVSNLYRQNPEINAHSCTSGVGGGSAICISSDDSSIYDASSDKHIRFKLTVVPEEDKEVVISQFSFFEKSPEYFSWIVGGEGLNNYPNKFAVSIKVNDSIVYTQVDQTSTRDWKLRTFDLAGNVNFVFRDSTEIEFSMMAYDLVGNESFVTAWDLDEIQVVYSCSDKTMIGNIHGVVTDVFDHPIADVELQLFDVLGNIVYHNVTNSLGQYAFENLLEGANYSINANYNGDVLKGVTAIDLLQIKRHILGLNYISTPYQYIAADVNFDHEITAIDLLYLSRLILGISESFPHDKPWIFIDEKSHIDIDNFWHFNENIQVNSKDTILNLKGIKIGDVK